jgi:hypothetical protein
MLCNTDLHAVCLVMVEGDTRLPRASTCFNTLYLPLYSSQAVLERRLVQAITGGQSFDEGGLRSIHSSALTVLLCSVCVK